MSKSFVAINGYFDDIYRSIKRLEESIAEDRRKGYNLNAPERGLSQLRRSIDQLNSSFSELDSN